jgi:hypothetical protein
MDDSDDGPARLLYQLAQGQLAEEELDLLEAMMRAEGLDMCPPELRHRASRLAQPQPRTVPYVGEAVERLVRLVRPVFDSWSAPQLAGVRGHGGSSHQLLLKGPDAEISLHVQPLGINRVRLIGQVFGPARSSGEAVLRRAEGPVVALVVDKASTTVTEYGPVAVDDLGEFMFAQIHAGRYILQVQLATERIDSIVLALRAEPADGDPELEH